MRACENCDAKIPAGVTSCPECGLYAGEYVEGRAVHPRRPRYRLWLGILVVVALIGAVSVGLARPELIPLPWLASRLGQPEPSDFPATPVRIVKDRPGGARRAEGASISEPEAMRLLRRSFTKVKTDCLAILGNGDRDGAYEMTVMNRCDRTRLGRWRVDGRTGAVSPVAPGSAQ